MGGFMTWEFGITWKFWDIYGNPIPSQKHSNISFLFFVFYLDRWNVERQRRIARIPKKQVGTAVTPFLGISQMLWDIFGIDLGKGRFTSG
jgi:hypothetical protein